MDEPQCLLSSFCSERLLESHRDFVERVQDQVRGGRRLSIVGSLLDTLSQVGSALCTDVLVWPLLTFVLLQRDGAEHRMLPGERADFNPLRREQVHPWSASFPPHLFSLPVLAPGASSGTSCHS